jgi:hypothetical protein
MIDSPCAKTLDLILLETEEVTTLTVEYFIFLSLASSLLDWVYYYSS